MKVCSTCKVEKPLSEFSTCKGKPLWHCKECAKAKSKAYYQKNKADLRKVKQDKYAESQAYRDASKVRAKKWRDEKSEAFHTSLKKYYKANLSVFKANQHLRRARLLSNGGSFTAEEWDALKESYGFKCLRCGKREPEIALTPDHVIPVSKQGSNDISNIQPLCLYCNKSKHDKTCDYRCKETI